MLINWLLLYSAVLCCRADSLPSCLPRVSSNNFGFIYYIYGGGGGGRDLGKSIDYLLIFVSEWTTVKYVFVATKQVFCRDKYVCFFFFAFFFFAFLSHDKTFVAASILLLRQKTCFVATKTCLSLQK